MAGQPNKPLVTTSNGGAGLFPRPVALGFELYGDGDGLGMAVSLLGFLPTIASRSLRHINVIAQGAHLC